MRVTKTVHERDVTVSGPSIQEEIQIERVPIDRVPSEPVSVRYEGDTIIVPAMEEVAVVEKRLRLREEWRITKRQVSVERSHPICLWTEEVQVERLPAQARSETSGATVVQ